MTLFSTARTCGLVCFLLFTVANIAVFLLRNRPALAFRIAYCIAVFLLLYKSVEYTYFQCIGRTYHIPVEFSALSYFLYGFLIAFRIRKLEEIGVFCAVLAGSVYSLAFWIAPQAFVGEADSPFLFAMAICNHHLLYFGGMLLLAYSERFSFRSLPKIFFGVGLCLCYGLSVYLFTPYAAEEGKPLIAEICDGSILLRLFPTPIPVWGYILYYCLASCALLLAALLFCLFSQKCAERRYKHGLCFASPE